LNLFGILITISSIVGTIAYFINDQKKAAEPIDAYGDYERFLEAASLYKEEHDEFAKDLIKLKPYIENFDKLPIKRYDLSLDGKFLVVKQLSEEEGTRLINEIGGESYINSHLVYLTLLRRNDLSKVKPIAHFNIKPDSKINTMSVIQYDTSGCIAEEGVIVEKKWENKQTTFKNPGAYTIKLKIKDKNGNWSEEFSREIKVVEEQGIKAIEAYNSSFYYVFKSGRTLSKGKNEFGQLGIGSLNPIHDLKYNSVYDGVAEVACGENFTIFRLNDGSVCAAGINNSGELGTGDKTPQRLLNTIWGLENIKQIAAGKRFAAALDMLGNVYVWGDNSENQIMKEDINEALMPTKLEGVDNVKEIALGSNFGLALKYDGTVMAWGDNTHGQLGIGYKGNLNEPVVTLYKNVKAIAAGDKFSLIANDKGHVFGSGYNAYGQLGVRGKSEVLFPVELLKIKDIEVIKAKDSLVIAITNIGKAYVWGNFNTPAVKPIHEPEEIVGIQYIHVAANNGKKCFVIDNNQMMYTISNSVGKPEVTPVYDSFYTYKENNKD